MHEIKDPLLTPGIIDCHNHSVHFSPDSSQPLLERIEEAKRKGLAGLIMTDHYDKDMVNGELVKGYSPVGSPPAPGEWIFDVEPYFEHYGAVKRDVDSEDFGMYIGIELGYAEYLVDAFNAWTARYPFDALIGSVHSLNDIDFYYVKDIYKLPREDAYSQYLDTLTRMTEQLDYDICGHFDYICRYADYGDNQMVYARMPEAFDRFLQALVAHDRCLEINTASFLSIKVDGKPLGAPDPEIIERYRALGGDKICLSSDAHHEGRSAQQFNEAIDWLRRCGVTHLTHYVKRQPIQTPI